MPRSEVGSRKNLKAGLATNYEARMKDSSDFGPQTSDFIFQFKQSDRLRQS